MRKKETGIDNHKMLYNLLYIKEFIYSILKSLFTLYYKSK